MWLLLKKILLVLFCFVLTACSNDGIKYEANEQKPTYRGDCSYVFDDIKGKTVPEGFITRKMASDIKKVIKAHKSKNDSEDGSIDEETAVDIAIAIMKNPPPDNFFEKPTFYCLSYKPDLDAYIIDIGQENENPNVLGGLSTKMVISKKDGTLLAIWTS